ncbi:MAG: Poly-beta-1,6-N-acetyl-D-glucosamine synthase [Syntrophorhabdus sp. PtaU1.Bin050]|nr:MAG: Poly-beta-1,6-N-acetyl-D-glucosamine synthase [Syntrophorhabdus sp. PtaU1.Bin050]
MPQTQPKYPEQKPDRRRRNKSRPNASDRRATPRYHSDFPVTICENNNGKEIIASGIARDVSDGGMFIEMQNADGISLGADIKIKFIVPNTTMPEQYIHGRLEVDAKVVEADQERNVVRINFKESMSKRLSRRAWRYLRIGATFTFVIAVVLIVLTKVQNIYFFWFDIPVFLYSICVGSYLVSRFLFAAFYRTPKPQAQARPLPTVTLVIPVYNEEDLVKRTLTYALEVAYPKDKIEFIAVNDGSKDGSLAAIEEFRKDYPELVVINLEKNHGKRYALAAGARIAKGDIIAFMDSDSFLKPDAIENLMQGFADPKVAAVSGHCEVENQWTNFLTKMQTVRYYVGFRIMKGAESVFDSVTCLSGPLSAYRKEIVMEFIDDWVNQKFLGRPATFGDDRSLTNFILKKHRVIYDSRAVTTTFVPENYSQFFRQQARWKRSWFRESLRAAAFMWRKQPLMSISFYLGFILPVLGPAVVLRAMLYMPIFHSVTPLNYIAGIALMSCLMCSAYLFAKKSRLWFYGIPFCFFYMFLLIWQLPWAIATFWESDWGTRG